MALKRNETYPGRFSNPTDDHPQGAFKNRSAPGAQDGSYLEQQWANDWDGFFGRLLTLAEISPNGNVDTASSSQYYDALKSLFLQRTNPFGDINSDGTVEKALENLGLGTAATKNVGTGAGQIPDMSFFSASLLAAGWQKLPSGLIIQWGQVLSNSSGFAPWTYPIAFPNACFQVYATPFVAASANNFTLTTIGNPGLTAVTTACYVNGVQSSTVGQVGVRYLAIGN